MLGFRRKLNEDPELVKLLCTRFVPVAVDHEVERRNDAEGKLYLNVAGKAVSNSVFAFDPSGKVLFQRLGDEIYQKFAPALEAAVKEYQPAKALAAVRAGDVGHMADQIAHDALRYGPAELHAQAEPQALDIVGVVALQRKAAQQHDAAPVLGNAFQSSPEVEFDALADTSVAKAGQPLPE